MYFVRRGPKLSIVTTKSNDNFVKSLAEAKKITMNSVLMTGPKNVTIRSLLVTDPLLQLTHCHLLVFA